MRTIIAVVGRVFVRCIGGHFDDHLEVLFLTGRNVRIEEIIKPLKLDYRDESRRSCLAIEAEHRFLISAACLERSFSRLRVFRCDCSRLRNVLRVSAFGVTASFNGGIDNFGSFRCVRSG